MQTGVDILRTMPRPDRIHLLADQRRTIRARSAIPQILATYRPMTFLRLGRYYRLQEILGQYPTMLLYQLVPKMD